ncbi:MAG: hypothetical protein EAZ64_06420 [Sphingobacteriales bacterium]|nr:MAG: hypothetical protein EAZ64_06420 [Sphingobacteriales bacterium]
MKFNKRNEILNLITGGILVTVGILMFFKNDVPSGFNWLIFGSMYLVMDGYKTSHTSSTFTKMCQALRNVFSIIGTIASIALLAYYLLI